MRPSRFILTPVTGPSTITGNGAIEAQASAVSGSGSILRYGIGALSAQSSSVSGSGTVLRYGIGALSAQSAGVDGAGTVLRYGIGSLSAQSAQISGTGSVGDTLKTGTGALAAGVAQLAGVGGVNLNKLGLWSNIETDVEAIMAISGTAVTWTVGATDHDLFVFWRGETADDGAGMGPMIELAETDVPKGADYGDTVTHNSIDYAVARFLPDGHGLMTVLLKE